MASPARSLPQPPRARALAPAPLCLEPPPPSLPLISPCRLAAGWRPACPHCGKRRGEACQACKGANWPALPALPLATCEPRTLGAARCLGVADG